MIRHVYLIIDRTLTGTITPGQSGPGSNGNEGILYIPQNLKTGISSSDGLISYPEHLLVGSGFVSLPLHKSSQCIRQTQLNAWF